MAWHPRLVALDIDGTLIGHDGRLPRSIFSEKALLTSSVIGIGQSVPFASRISSTTRS